MKLLCCATTAALLFACSDENARPAAMAGSSSSSSSSGGLVAIADDPLVTARPYDTTVPRSYREGTPAPLVLVLHGYTGNAKGQDTYFGVSALAQQKGFLVALPNGTKDSTGKGFWAATDACCNFMGAKVDDLAYLRAVIADMKRRFTVDPKRIYVVGHSNGGFMGHRLACELDDIAAIVSLAGGQVADATKCNPKGPVAVLQVHGEQDETIHYEGGALFGKPYPSAKATVATWAAKNGCAPELTMTDEKLDLESTLAGSETTVARHACTKGAAELWTIAGGRHIPTFAQPAWAEAMYGFLEAHPKP